MLYYFLSSSSADGGEDEAAYTPETEEQRQLRLIQLLNIPQVPSETAHWTPLTGDDERGEGEGEGEGEGGFSLNVAELADSLKTVPTHKRLDIASELLEHYGVSERDLDFSGRARESETTVDKHGTAGGGRDTASLLLSRSVESSLHFPGPSKLSPDHQPLVVRGETVPESELEALLRAATLHPDPEPVASSQSSTHQAPPSTHTPSHPPPITSTTSHPQPQLPSTDELDDMLDDLLSI